MSDTGCGIAPEEQKRIFDEFSRADTAGKEGSGFGLAVVSRLVELLGGTLELDSRIGEGSVFRVSIPVLSVSVSEIPKPVPADTRCRGRSLATSHVGRNTEIGRSQGLLL